MFLGKRLEAHSLSTSLAFNDLFYAPVCPPLSIHKVILLGRANEGQVFLNSFESIYSEHFLLLFLLFSLLQTEFCVFYDVLSIVHKSQFILSFCLPDVICINRHHPLYSFFCSGHVF